MIGIQWTSAYQQINSIWQKKTTGKDRAAKTVPGFSDISEKLDADKAKQEQRMREMLRELKRSSRNDQNPYSATTQDKKNGFLELSGSPEADKEEEEKKNKPVNYNSKEVESKIQQAKNSTGAAQAVISAKRKVLEVKRKISAGEGDPEELQLALTHARRMELVARKKKNHLEMEELARITQKRDERADKEEEAAQELKSSVVSADEEKISRREDKIFDERQKIISDAVDEFNENPGGLSDKMLSDMNKMIAEFGEDELKELEEAMEMLEDMEIINPHMSKEDLEDLKRKHRASEEKAMVKADMDYLKGMIKHQMDKGPEGFKMEPVSAPVSTTAAVSVPDMSAAGCVSIDVQV
ncbi:MAG: hypothetical protein IKR23_00985 [Lachnospiraceae bacterium]|nr:hypothetical protein [Lachnospiraceae bacterium]